MRRINRTKGSRLLLRVVLAALIALTCERASAQTLESPRLRALQEAVEKGSTTAVDSLWSEIEAKGAPLIERVGEHRDYVLVTFLWRHTPDTKHVVVDGVRELNGTRRVDNLMTRLAGTSIWYRSYWLHRDVRTIYRIGINTPLTPAANEQGLQPDPLNPKKWAVPQWPNRPSPAPQQSLLELPDAVPQPWVVRRSDVPSGELRETTWKSALLKNERPLWVYLPPGYRTDGPRYSLMVTTDGDLFAYQMEAAITLDNLIAAKRIPPVVAVFVGNAPDVKGQRPTRSVELTCNESFLEFLATEIVPWIRSNYYVAADPSRTIIAGISYGGLNAAFAGLRRPNMFGHVLSMSGSFWWRNAGDPEGEWLTRQVIAWPKANLKFYMDAGRLENGVGTDFPPNWIEIDDRNAPFGASLLVSNRHMRDVLKAKGYEVHYAEVGGAHNPASWRGTFADGLIALLGNDTSRRTSR